MCVMGLRAPRREINLPPAAKSERLIDGIVHMVNGAWRADEEFFPIGRHAATVPDWRARLTLR
jgi:hypothetical protein